jgi:hypothetical protein
MMGGVGGGMGSKVGGLSGLYFRGIDWYTVVSWGGIVSPWSGVCNWGISGMDDWGGSDVGMWCWGWSLWQVGGGYLESMDGV